MTAKWGKYLCSKGTFVCTHRFATCSNALWCGRPPKHSHLCSMGNTNSLLTTSYISILSSVDILQHTYVFKAGWWQLGQKKHHKTRYICTDMECLLKQLRGEYVRIECWVRGVQCFTGMWWCEEEFWVLEVKVDIEAMQQTHILLIKSYVKPNHVFGALCGERTIMIFFQENMLDSQEMEIWHCLSF